MGIAELLAGLLERIGLKKSNATKYDKAMDTFREAKAGLNDQIATLEGAAVAKKKEYDAAVGDTKRIVGGEIEQIIADLDRLRNREVIIESVIARLSGVQERVLVDCFGKEKIHIDEDLFDGLISELEAIDRSAEGLEQVRCETPRSEQIDVESRMAASEGQTESAGGLSQSTLDRLKQLDAEE